MLEQLLVLSLTFVLAFFLSLYGMPRARLAALKFGIVDRPDGKLKQHREPVPYLGGLALYLAFLVSLAFTFEFRQDVLGIVLAGTLMVMVGLIDDFGVMSPGTKLAGQCLAVFILIKSGVHIQIAAFPEWLDLLLTVVWMIGIINAFNLLDIMDGLSAGVGLISAGFLLATAVLNHDSTIAFMLAALAGSLLGFLRFNFHPASIYMGDTGAMFLGLMLGALAMIGRYPGGHQAALLSPVFILGFAVFDTLFVMYVRMVHGRPVFLGSPDHLALRLRRRGFTVPQVVAMCYVMAVALGSVGLALLFVSKPAAIALVAMAGIGMGGLTLAFSRTPMLDPATPAVPRPSAAIPTPEGPAGSAS
jgi:UDP-GlcNAc:undecaprenyl-phosphate GlcNAc-1-phosphate transferase